MGKKLKKYIIEKNSFYRIAYKYVNNKQDALDIVQESILKSLSKIDKLENIDSIKPWFYTILINTCIDYTRQNKKYTEIVEKVSSYIYIDCDIEADIGIQMALDNLPKEYKTVVIVRYFKDMKIPYIAKILDKNGVEVSVDVAKVEGLKDKKLEKDLNEELEKEAKALYQQYVEQSKTLEKSNKQSHQMLRSSYEVKVNNENILSLVVSNYEFQASSDTTRKFYNINKKSEKQITLKSMFKNVDYINIISENIKSQMEK